MAMPMQMLDRATLVRRGAGLLAGGAALGLAPAAFAAVPDEDLAYVRLLIGVELLEVDFQAQALASGRLDPQTGRLLRTIAAQEKAHLTGLSVLVTNAGQVPATADDVDFAYPKGTFASAAKIQRLADTIETLALGAYLGAVENVQTAAWRLPLGQIAATESRHVGALAAAAGKPVLGRAFAPSLQIDAVSAALDVYES
jgi:NAD(P)-dependent dehydrogenase (short-subunit alcohol dehydrogenase family)